MSAKDSEAMKMVEECFDQQDQMNQWESDFIQSMMEKLGKGRQLSLTEINKLEEIWEKVAP